MTDRKKGMKLCILSIVLHVLSFFTVLFAIGAHGMITGMLYDSPGVQAGQVLFLVLCVVIGLSGPVLFITSLVLMIITRVKYPKNRFGLALMILYIAENVLSFLVVAITVISLVFVGVSTIGELFVDMIHMF